MDKLRSHLDDKHNITWIKQALSDFKNKLGRLPSGFVYPAGKFNEHTGRKEVAGEGAGSNSTKDDELVDTRIFNASEWLKGEKDSIMLNVAKGQQILIHRVSYPTDGMLLRSRTLKVEVTFITLQFQTRSSTMGSR